MHDDEVFALLAREADRQAAVLDLHGASNHASAATRAAEASVLSDNYASGYPGSRTYPGCEHVDAIEALAMRRALRLFGGAHANVQPHSGTQANLAVLGALLSAGELLLSLHPHHGGHVTHGSPRNWSGRLFRVMHYETRGSDGSIDYDQLEQLAVRHRPRLIIGGFASYPRRVDWSRLRAAADACGAHFMADMAQVAGLVAAGCFPSPVEHADVTTSSTNKSLRGPRGGLILCRDARLASALDAALFPGTQCAPFANVLAAKAVALGEAAGATFRALQQQTIANGRALCSTLSGLGHAIAFGGTDTGSVFVDLADAGLSAAQALERLYAAGIRAGAAHLPGSSELPTGLRLSMSAATVRGMAEEEASRVGRCISRLLVGPSGAASLAAARDEVHTLCALHPIPR